MNSAYYYIEAYDKIKERYSEFGSIIYELKIKILRIKYSEAEKYRNEKEYTTAIDILKEYLEDKDMRYDMRKDYKELLLNCLYLLGKNEYSELFIFSRTI